MELKQAIKTLHQAGFQIRNRKGVLQNTEKPHAHDDDTIKKACARLVRSRVYKFIQKLDSDEEIIL